METENLNKTISQIFECRYVIPLYQRNFAWREEEIIRLLKDIFESYTNNGGGYYFIGSLVVRKRNGIDYEVIDGQQRLTVLSLVTRLLGINQEQRLFYDSRPQTESFLKAFYADPNSIRELSDPSIVYLKEAVDVIRTANLNDKSEGGTPITIYDELPGGKFVEYFANRVILVRVEIPEDTDVASYFEIMNNRGEQLQEHEILKAMLVSRIKVVGGTDPDLEKQKEFSLIWDACSQIDRPIQKVFNTERRRQYFGKQFDDFIFTSLTGGGTAGRREGFSIDYIIENEIIDHDVHLDNTADEKIDFTDESEYSSIIDFPNFIMHIFKAFYDESYKAAGGDNAGIPLDSKYMLKVYGKIKNEIDPEDFIYRLFRSRTFFDRYVVKTIQSKRNDAQDDITWSLQKVKLQDTRMSFVDTFDDRLIQNRVTKALTMLQVTFRTRKYKNWMQEAIRWFACQESIVINPYEYVRMLDNYMLGYFDRLNISTYDPVAADEEITIDNSISTGVKTPHFLFNFIDYLYWSESRNRIHDIKYSDRITDFDFKYWNSVEHHLSRQKAAAIEGSANYIDNLGNLCLLSKSSNSRLSDRDVKEKVQNYSDARMGPNRQIIYQITRQNNYEWDYQTIKAHYNDIIDLLKKCREILHLSEQM